MSRPMSRVSRVVMVGPLAPFADAYRLELRERGYTPRTAVGQLRQVARLSRWLEASGLTVRQLSVKRVEKFLAVRRTSGRFCSQWSRPGLLCLLDVCARVLTAEEPAGPASPTEALLASFEHYLRAERGLAAGTARGYVGHARRFLDGLSLNGDLAEQITTVRRFIAQHDGKMVETSVVGKANVDPLYTMGLASRNLTEDLSVVVVDPPSDAAVVV